MVGHITDVIIGSVLMDCVTVVVVALLDWNKGFSVSLIFNCLLLACLLLFLTFFLLAGLLGTGAFCSEGELDLSG